MFDWIRSKFEAISHIFIWLILGVGASLTSFQVHGTLISLAIEVVNNPSLRPTGWTTGTVYGLSRLLWLVVGIGWLGWVMFTFDYLRETTARKTLKQRFFRLLLILCAVYFSSYVTLLFIA